MFVVVSLYSLMQSLPSQSLLFPTGYISRYIDIHCPTVRVSELFLALVTGGVLK